MKKIKIVLLGVILIVGFFSCMENVLAQDTCFDPNLKISGVCKSECLASSETEINIKGRCSTENIIDRRCCASSATVNAIKDKIAADELATKKAVTSVPQDVCCINGTGNDEKCVDPKSDKTCSDGTPIVGKTCAKLKTEGRCGGGASSSSSASAPIEFSNPIGVTTVSGLLDSILNNLMGLIVIIAVIFIIIGGIMYMTSAGNEKMVTRAKQTWTGATVGLAIALASPTFLKQIKIILESNSDTGGSADAWVNKALTIKDIAINVLNFLLSVFGVLAIIALVIGGGMYLTAYGDEKKIDSGKKIITYAIIGIVVALSALVVTRQIAGLIGVMAK